MICSRAGLAVVNGSMGVASRVPTVPVVDEATNPHAAGNPQGLVASSTTLERHSATLGSWDG